MLGAVRRWLRSRHTGADSPHPRDFTVRDQSFEVQLRALQLLAKSAHDPDLASALEDLWPHMEGPKLQRLIDLIAGHQSEVAVEEPTSDVRLSFPEIFLKSRYELASEHPVSLSSVRQAIEALSDADLDDLRHRLTESNRLSMGPTPPSVEEIATKIHELLEQSEVDRSNIWLTSHLITQVDLGPGTADAALGLPQVSPALGVSDDVPRRADREAVAPLAEETIEHTLARLFLRLGPPPEPTENHFVPAGNGGGGAQQ